MRSLLWLPALLFLATSCDKIHLPALPALDLEALPVVKGARKLLVEVADARLEIDPTVRDALTALGQCVDLVTDCHAATGETLGSCLDRAPSCASDTPWYEPQGCCPQSCKTAYAAAVTTAAPVDAFESVFFLSPDCFPGVRAALGGAQ